MDLAILGFAVLFALLLVGVPVGAGMAAVGIVGFALIVGWQAAFATVGEILFSTARSYELSVIPLFVLMGNLVARSNLSHELYDAAHAFLGHLRGGLAMATIVACTGFSAVCGSSLATAATMSRVAMPAMRRYGYADTLAAGSVAAGGTLGILIPPSAALILYGLITRADIGKLFIAGILPGLLGMACYLGAIAVQTRRNRELGPPGERSTGAVRLRALAKVWGVLALFVLVLGGLYFGVFTATEAAGVGASGAFLFALLRRKLTLAGMIDVLLESALTTAMLFFILFGALLFSNFMNVAGVPRLLAGWAGGLEIAPTLVVVAIMAIYVVLGCLLETISMMLLTVPIFFPVVSDMGVDLIWFGIVVVVAMEISLITPPIGLNVFVLNAMLPDIPLARIFRGVLPFVLADVVRLAILLAFPAIALTLPGLMR